MGEIEVHEAGAGGADGHETVGRVAKLRLRGGGGGRFPRGISPDASMGTTFLVDERECLSGREGGVPIYSSARPAERLRIPSSTSTTKHGACMKLFLLIPLLLLRVFGQTAAGPDSASPAPAVTGTRADSIPN
jgi:hypothetical protein